MVNSRKVAIIGSGHVGSHVLYTFAWNNLANEIYMIDKDPDLAIAQAKDCDNAQNYFPNTLKIGTIDAEDYGDLSDFDLIVHCAGPLPKPGETRMDGLQVTIDAIRDIPAKILKSGFAGFIITISNPADVVAHYLQTKLNWPVKKIVSTSTTLDSARFRGAISDYLKIDRKSITGYTLGEHGESQFPVWSQVTVAGQPLDEYLEKTGKTIDKDDVFARGKGDGWTVFSGKHSTEFGIGTSAYEVAKAYFNNEHRVLSVSTYLDGEYDQSEVFTSVPTVIGSNGVEEIIEFNLNAEERAAMQASCSTMRENYQLSLNM